MGCTLFFANAELFEDRALDAVAASPTPVRWLIVAPEPVTSVDVTAADALAELDDILRAAGVELCFCRIERSRQRQAGSALGFFLDSARSIFFPTIDAAVDGYRQMHVVEWVHREERRS